MRYIRVKHAVSKIKVTKAFCIATLAAFLAFPIAGVGGTLGTYYGVYLNGQLIGSCATKVEARKAYLSARQLKNQEGIALLDVDVTVGPVEVYDRDLLTKGELETAIYDKLDNYKVDDVKQLAYTLKVNDYTVTLASKEEVVALLEKAQASYDADGKFQVALTTDEERESNSMKVVVNPLDDAADRVAATETMSATLAVEGEAANITSEQMAVNDGIVGVDFNKTIQVSETYVTADAITDADTALAEITKENEEEEIYEVKSGDCLSTIATNHGMTTDELLAMNEGMTVDSNILIGDEIVVTVPESEISVVVSEQKTYEEEYDGEVQYQDDENSYIGTNTTIQEGVPGQRTVTAIISYENGVETGREIIHEEIIKEAVPKIVKRGTKALPTYIMPISNGRRTSGFGQRWGRLHKGIDWACPVGTTVRASRGGRVVSAGWNGSYGYSILIDHGDGVRTRYAHLSKVLVSSGEYVDQGEKIGLSGNTGRSTGPHLHFEIIINGTPVNPDKYL